MTIKNIRQFNAILKTVGSVEQHYTDLLVFAVDNINRHGNKDPMLTFLNAPFLRTKAGKIKKAYFPLIQWLQVACPAFHIGEPTIVTDDGSPIRTIHTAHSMPSKIGGFNVVLDKSKDMAVQPFTEWLEQSAEKAPAAPTTKVTAKSLVKYLDSKLALSLTASDQSELDALVKAAKGLIIAAGKATLPDADLTRVEKLANTKASRAEKTANKKAI